MIVFYVYALVVYVVLYYLASTGPDGDFPLRAVSVLQRRSRLRAVSEAELVFAVAEFEVGEVE